MPLLSKLAILSGCVLAASAATTTADAGKACDDCIAGGGTFNLADNTCAKVQCRSTLCINDTNKCPGKNPCFDCTIQGKTYDLNAKLCRDQGCRSVDCITMPDNCPAPDPCVACIESGKTWNLGDGTCANVPCRSALCIQDVAKCKPAAPADPCKECISGGKTWNLAGSTCADVQCRSVDCITDESKCPAPVDLSVCTDLPVGLCYGGLMVPGAAYKVAPMFDCKEGDAKMKFWCEVDEKAQKHVYKYCCDGDKCEGVPKNTAKCEYEGKEYHVGKAYDAKDADGKNVTVWCTDADTVVTCTPEDCGTTRELTPPGIKECPVENAPDTALEDCHSCIAGGKTYNLLDFTCVDKMCRSTLCLIKESQCPSGAPTNAASS